MGFVNIQKLKHDDLHNKSEVNEEDVDFVEGQVSNISTEKEAGNSSKLGNIVTTLIDDLRVRNKSVFGLTLISNKKIQNKPEYEVSITKELITLYLFKPPSTITEFTYHVSKDEYRNKSRVLDATETERVKKRFIRSFNDLKKKAATMWLLVS